MVAQVVHEEVEFRDPVGYPSTGGYESRAIGITYDNLSSTFGQTPARWTSVANHKHILEDISFVPGPWATQATRLITTMTFGRWRAFGGPYAGDYVFRFWDKDDVSFSGFLGTGTPMINANATPIATVRVAFTNQNSTATAGTGSQTTAPLTGLPGGGVSIPDDGFYLEVSVVEPGTDTLLLTDTLRTVIASNSTAPSGGNAATVGSTLRDLGWDADQNGEFLGQPAFGTPERYSYSVNSMAAGYMFRVSGDIVPQPPSNTTPLGCIPDTGLVRTGDTLNDASALWYELCLAGPATDVAYQFFNADTEGSTSNVSMALFNDQGTMVAFDHDSGSGTQAQLTFGVGRLGAVGDGLQYDGRHGQLTAGTYYLAVAPHGSTFGDGFTANAAGVGGLVNLHLATNVNGSAPPDAATPIINQVNFDLVIPGGPIQFPDARPGTSVATGLRGIQWNTFEITAEAGSGDSYLDLDFAGRCGVGFDPIAYIFDANGNVAAFSDDHGPTLFPQFSFGAGAGSRTYGSNPVPFTGANGNLPAGRYYVGIGLVAVQTVNGHPNGARWHMRGTSGSNGNVGFDIYTGGTPAGACDPDVNCDGSANGVDVEVQELAVGGDFTDYCQVGLPNVDDGDFNRDGAVNGTDVEAVENAVGGVCP
ncbi:MAG: hypothetical protein HBSAPP03_10050 [Phycisphaerae bacterium]|nr:MAG: hypothetical protein HBSAPP03_10050 [Phycisphaerae bacterium]